MGKRRKRTPGKKYPGIMINCDHCGKETQKVSSTQRFCKAKACQKVSKRGNRTKSTLECGVCGKTVFRKSWNQVRCGSKECERIGKKKTPDLGQLKCPYCKRTVKKTHPWQKCCGTKKCRSALIRANKAHTRKHHGKTLVCQNCGDVVPRRTHNQRFCPASKKCNRLKRDYTMLTCQHCRKRAKRRSPHQVTCMRDECQKKQQRTTLLVREPRKRTGERRKCRFCSRKFEVLSSIHYTCNRPKCAKKQKTERADFRFVLERKRNPKLCLICVQPIEEKRIRYHKECRRLKAQERRDRRQYEQNINKVRAEAAPRNKKNPADESRRPRRMEELKCARQLQRTS